MKFVIKTKTLVDSLNLVTKIKGTNSVQAIFFNLKFSLTENKLDIVSSDGATSILNSIPKTDSQGSTIIEIGRVGEILVSSKVADIVRLLEGDTVCFELIDNSILKINDSKSSFRLNTINANEYPDLNFTFNEENGLLLSSESFISIINQVAFAAANKGSKEIMKAVNISCENGVLYAAATDAARLSRKQINVAFNKKVSANIPARTLQDISKMLLPNTNITTFFESNRVIFKFDNSIIVTGVVSGDYPPIGSIINKSYLYTLDVSANEIIKALERVSVLFIDKDIVARFKLSRECCKVLSKSSQLGSTEEVINMFKYDGEDLSIAFNSSFVLEAIRATGQQDIQMSFSGGTKPFMIKAPGDDSLVQIVTPLRINEI